MKCLSIRVLQQAEGHQCMDLGPRHKTLASVYFLVTLSRAAEHASRLNYTGSLELAQTQHKFSGHLLCYAAKNYCWHNLVQSPDTFDIF